MRILVTGASGFIGSHLVRELRKRGDEVLGLDKKTGHDLTDTKNHAGLAVGVWGPDCIVHLASTCSTPGSVKDPLGTFNDTVVTAVNVLEAARESDTPIIVTSSVKARDGQTPYGAAKRMVEAWSQEYAAAYGLPVIVNRPGTVYGPGQEGSEDSGWIAWFCKARRDGFPVVLNGDGQQVRDLLHVNDYVRLLIRQIDDFPVYTSQVWDVGGGWPNAVTVQLMADHLNLDYTFGPARYGDSPEYVGLNSVPYWTPEVDWFQSETLR